jgi:hypothetical protein
VLGFEVLDEIDGFLKRHSVFEPYTPSSAFYFAGSIEEILHPSAGTS